MLKKLILNVIANLIGISLFMLIRLVFKKVSFNKGKKGGNKYDIR